ncbi:Toxoplasma gondii family C protein, partial [Toxoplasma gondii TgCatPRC2]
LASVVLSIILGAIFLNSDRILITETTPSPNATYVTDDTSTLAWQLYLCTYRWRRNATRTVAIYGCHCVL